MPLTKTPGASASWRLMLLAAVVVAGCGAAAPHAHGAPTPTITATSPLDATPISFNVNFGSVVNGFDGTDITLTGTATPLAVTGFTEVSKKEYTFVVSPTTPGTITINIAADVALDNEDDGNNPGTLTVTYPDAAPTAAVTADQGSPTNAATIVFTVTFSEDVTTFVKGDITLSGTAAHGGAAAFAGTGSTYTFGVTPTSDGTIAVDIPAGIAVDAARQGNKAAERFYIIYDGTGPTPAIAYAQSGAADLRTMPFAAKFGEGIDAATFTAADVSASSGTVQGPRLAPQSGATIGGPGHGTGNDRFNTPRGVAVDVHGNIYVADSGNHRVQIFDSARNYVASITGTVSPNGVAVDGSTGNIYASYANGTVQAYGPDRARIAALPHTFMAPGAVAVDGAGNIYVSDTPAGRVEIFDSARTHVANIAAIVPFGVAADGEGNIYVGWSNNTVQAYGPDRVHVGALDGTFGGPRNIAVDGSGRIYVASSDGGTVQVFDSARTHIADLPGTFSSPYGVAVDGLSGAIYVANQSAHSILTFDAAYAFDVTGPAAGDVLTVSVPAGGARDEAGNDNLASNTVSIGVDTAGPTPVIGAAQQDPTNAAAINFRVNFGESVTGFEASDVVLSGPADAVADFAALNATAYSFDVSPTADGTILVDVAAGAAEDLLGGSSLAAEQFSISYDGTGPIPTFATTAAGPASLSIVPFTLEFSKGINASTFDASDIDASSGTVENLLAVPKHDANFGSLGTANDQFTYPAGIAVDGSGSIYVSDYPEGNHRVRVFDSDRNYVASLPGIFNGPTSVAVDGSAGSIYVVNSSGATVQVFDSATRAHTAALPGTFLIPYGVEVDGSAGSVYVSDSITGRVQIFDSTTRAYVADLFAADPDAAPAGVAVDGSAGSVYVVMQGNDTVQVFDSATRAHTAALPGTFSQPAGVAVDAFGSVYVASANSANSTVQIFGPDGEYIADLQGQFNGPTDIAADASSGRVYVVDRNNHTVQVFVPAYAFDVENPDDMQVLNVSMPAGRVRDTIGNDNVGSDTASIEIDRTGPTPIISSAQSSPTYSSPIGFEVDFREPVGGFEASDVVISGNATHGGVAGLVAVNATAYSFDVSPTADGTILVDVPAGVAKDRAGNDNAAAERFSIEYDDSSPIPAITAARPSPTGESPITFTVTFSDPVGGFEAADVALSGTAGPGPVANFTNASASTYTFDVVPSADGTVRVDVPAGAARDALDRPSLEAARFWVTYDGASPTPTIAAAAAPGPVSLSIVPFTVKFDEDVGASALGASAVDASSGTVQDPRLAPQHVATFGSYGGSLPLRNNTEFNNPSAVAADGSGNIYVADTNNDRVQVYDSGTNYVATLPGLIKSPRGVALDDSGNIYVADPEFDAVRVFDSGRNALPAISVAAFASPNAVAVDGAGNVYVSDAGAGRVIIFDSERSHVANLTGQPGSQFALPSGVAVDDSGNIYVADRGNDRVQMFDSARNHVADLPGPFDGPSGVAVDGSGNVYVADTGNNRTKIFDSARNYVADLPGPFDGPRGVAADGAGRIYVADSRNHSIQVYDAAHAFDVVNPDEGQLEVSVPAGRARDAAGNDNLASNTASITIDRTGPIPTVASPQGNRTNASPIAFTVTFDQPVTGFAANNITLSGDADPGPVTDFLGSGDTYTFSTVPATDGTVTVRVAPNAVRDALGNPSLAAGLSVTYDTEGPSTTVTADQGSPTSASAITFTVRFSDPVAEFDASGIEITGTAEHGGAANFTTADNMTYTFVVTPTSDGTILVDVPAGAARDLAGNDNTAAERLPITRDTARPAPTVTADQGSPTNASTIVFTVNFTKPVDGFAVGDVALSGDAARGGASNFATVNATTYTFVVTPASDGTIAVDIPEGAARDPPGNPSIASERFSIRYDGTGPTPVIASTETGYTRLLTVPFTARFGETVNGTTFDASDVDASSGTVQDLRIMLQHAANFGRSGQGNGEFNWPHAVAADGLTGYIYVADWGNHRVQVFDSARNHVATFGGSGQAPGQFNLPVGIAVDGSSGTIYVADTSNHRVQVFNSSRAHVADLPGPFNSPRGMAVDASGNVYVADTNNHRIRVFDSDRNPVANFGGRGSGNGQLRSPSDVAVDASAGMIYVADTSNSRIQVFDSATKSHAAYLPGPFEFPSGVAVDASGNVYVSDTNNHRIRVFDSGMNSAANITSSFNRPYGIAVDDSSGRIYVADRNPSRIQVFDAVHAFNVGNLADGDVLEVSVPAGRVLDLVGNENEASNAASIVIDRKAPVPAVTAAQSSPTNAPTIVFTVNFTKPVNGFAVGDVAISDIASGIVEGSFVAVNTTTYTFDVSPASDGTIAVSIPEGAARDPLGNPSIASERFSIRYDGTGPTPAINSTAAGTTNLREVPFAVEFGEAVDGTTFAAADVSASSGAVQDLRLMPQFNATLGGTGSSDGLFNGPRGAAVDGEGRIYAADTGNNRVQIFDPALGHADTIGGPGSGDGEFSGPGAVAVDSSSGAIYVADTGNNRVQVFDRAGAYVEDVPGHFSNPSGVAVDGTTGYVYVADRNNNVVQVFDSDRANVANITSLLNPSGVAVDGPAGRLYVANTVNNTVPVFDTATRARVADLNATFVQPTAVAVDGATGAVYVASAGSGAVLIFNSTTSDRIAGLPGQFDRPFGVAAGGPAGRIYVADALNNTVRIFDTAYAFNVAGPAGWDVLTVTMPAGSVRDAAGNGNAESNTASIFIAGGPTPIVSAVQDSPTNASTIGFTVDFGEPVDGFAAANVTLSGTAMPGGVDNFTTADNTTYTFDVAPSADGTVRVDVPAGAARDALDRPSLEAARFWITRDSASPTPAIAAAQPSSVSLVQFAVRFDEAVNGTTLAAEDIDASSGTVQGTRISPQRDSTFGRISVTSSLFDSPYGIAVDDSGNIYVADTGNNRVRVFDSGRNLVANISSQMRDPLGVAVDDFSGRVYVTDPPSNAVRVFDSDGIHVADLPGPFANPYGVAVDGAGNVYVSNFNSGTVRVFDSDRNYVADLPGPFDRPYLVAAGSTGSIYVADTGNNTVQIFDSATRDHVADLPGPSSNPAAVAEDGSGNVYVSNFGNGTVQVFDSARNHVAALPGPFGEPAGIAVDGSGTVYVVDRASRGDELGERVRTFSIAYEFGVASPSSGQVLDVRLPAGGVRDAAGNGNAESNTVSIGIDGTGPTPIITSAQPGPTDESPIRFTVNFGESVDGFAAANVTLSGTATHGGVADFGPVNATAYAFSVAPASDGTILVDIPEGAARDLLGNSSLAAAQFSIRYTGAAPVPTITSAAGPGPTSDSPIGFTVTFSKDVTGFDASGIALSGTAGTGAAVDNFVNASARTYTFDVEPTSAGTVLVDVPEGAASDSNGKGNEAAEQFSIRYTGAVPVPTITSDAGPGPTSDSPIGFTVTFSENVTGFNASGIEISGPAGAGASVDNFVNASARTYTFDVEPTSAGTVLVDVPEGAAADSDGNGNEAAEQFSIRYTGAVPVPTITSDAGPGPTSASPIGFTVTFSEDVTGFNETGIEISGPAGAGASVDNFVNASARTYTFDVEPTSVGTVLVDVPEGAASDSDGNGNEAAEQFSIRYAGAVPVPTITSGAGPGPATESPIGFTVTFSEDVTGFNASGIEISGPAGAGASVDNFVNASARTYTFDVAPLTVGTVLVDVPEGAAADSDGNGNEAAEQFSIRYTAAPVPTITSDAGPGPATESPIGFTVTFSKDVTGFNETGIEISGPAGAGASVDNFVNASARTYTFDVEPTSAGTVLVDVPEGAAADSDGNGNEAAEQFSIRYAGAVPVPTITSDAGPGPATESPIGFTVTFSENVTGFNETGIEISGPAGAGASVDNFVNASARTYTFDVAPLTVGTVLVDVPEGAASDSDGNGNEAAEQFSIRYAGALPVPTITSGAGPGPATESPIGFTVTFSEDVTGFNASGIEISGPAGAGASVDNFVNASARTYTFDVAPLTVGTVLVDVPEGAASDSDGNGNEAAEQFSIRYAGALPVPTITSDAGQGPATESPIGFTVTFSENVTGFNASGIEISGPAGAGASVDNFVNASARTYTFDVEPTSAGTVLVDVPEGAASDSDGNGNEAAEQFSIRYTAAPVPTITSDAGPGPTSDSPIGFTVTFSENVTGFNASGIEISGPAGAGASVGNFVNASARTYTFDVEPTSAGTVLVDVPEGAAADSDGNGNEAAEQFSIRYAGALPVPTITSGAGPGPTSASPIGFTVTFSEDVTGFNETGIEISGTAGAGASVGNFVNASARTYTFGVSPTTDGTVRIDIPAGVARDADDNGNEAAAGLSVVLDTAGPAAAVAPARADPTSLAAVPFAVKFSEGVNASALDESDIAASSGTVQDLRMVLRYSHTIGEENSPSAEPGKFNRPFGLAVDGSGYLYVTERAGKRIQVFDPAGNSVTTFGGLAADPDNPEPGQFRNIYGIAVDASSGRIYVADSVGNRVLAYDHNRDYLADLPGAPERPVALAVNATGHVYVSNAGNDTVQIFDSSWNWAAALPGTFNEPRGVAFGGPAGLAYVADRNDNTVRIFDPAGMPAGNFGTNGSGAGQFVRPAGVAVDDLAGRIYVTERGNQRVQVFDSGRNHVSYLSGFPNALDNPRGVAADAPAGRVYVADSEHHRVLVFDAAYEFSVADPADNQTLTVSVPAGGVQDAAGNDNLESNTVRIAIGSPPDPTPAVSTEHPSPTGAETIAFRLAFDRPADLATFDASDISVSSGTVQNLHSLMRNDGNITHDDFDDPGDVAVNASGYIYVANTKNNTVAIFDPDRQFIGIFPGDFNQPGGVTIDGSGSVYVADTYNNRIKIFDSALRLTDTIVKDFNRPFSVAVDDASGRIYVADTFADRVQVFHANWTRISYVTGFNDPYDVAVDGSGNLHVAVALEDRVRIFNSTLDSIHTIPDLSRPRGVAVDSLGTMYVANTAYHQIRIYDTARDQVASIENSFRDPYDVAIDGPRSTVYVADRNNDRIQVFNMTFAFEVADPDDNQTLTVSLPAGRARDAAGNDNTESNTVSIEIDRIRPLPTVVLSGTADAATINFTVTFSENVTGFDATGIELSVSANPHGVANFAPVNPTTYTFDASPAENGTVTVGIRENAAEDDAGNGNEAAQFSVNYTGASPFPVPTITSDAGPGPTSESPIGFTVNFTRPVTGFEAGDVVLSGAATGIDEGSFATADNKTYTFAVSPTTNGTVTVDVPANVAADAGGNNNTAAAQFSIEYNGAPPPPVPTITSAQPDPTNVSPISFTVNFTRPVTGFGATDVAISGAATGIDEGTFATADNRTYTFAVSPTTDGTLLVNVPANVTRDADGSNNTAARFSITYDNTGPIPTVASPQGLHTNASPINFTVTFDEPVDGFNATHIELSGDADPGPVADFDGSGAAYTFTVAPTTDGTVTVEVATNAVRDALGNPSPAANLSVTYDTEGPSTTVTADQGSPTNASAITFTVRFSDTVAWFNASRIAITGTAEHGGAGGFATADNMTYTFVVALTSDGTILVDVPAGAARDLAGNDNDAAERLSITRDAAPVPTITSDAQSDPTSESPIGFTVTFSENVTGFVATEIEISGIASGIDEGSFDPVNATAYTFTVSPTADGTVTVNVPANVAVDAGGNNNTAAAQFSIQYAAAPPAPAAPVPTITSAAAPGPATGLPIAFTVTFSKNVTGFEEGDIEISGIASSIDDGSFASTDNMTYTFTVSPTADGTVTVNVPANVAVDAGGNNNTAAAQFSIQYAAAPPAPAAPVPTITSAAAPGPATGLPIAFTVTFSKNVTGFEEGDIEISGIASSIDDGSFASTDNMTYTFTVSPTADGTVTVNVPANVAVDAGGNNNTAAAQFSIQYAAAPVPTITSAAAPGPATGLPIAFTVTFSKNVTGFEEGDIEISGIASSIDDGSFASTDNMTYTFTVSPTADGTVTVNVPANVAVDAGGNNNTAAAQFSIQYAAAPVPTITSAAAPGPATGLPIAFTVTFSKNVTGFEEGDIEISGIASSIDDGSFASTDNMTYTFTVSPTADGTVTVNVPANVAVDAGGNNNTAAAQFSIQYAAAPPAPAAPVPTITSAAAPGPATGLPIAFTVTFSKNVTGFEEGDIEISGIASSIDDGSFASTDNMTYTFTVSPTADGTVTVNVPANVAVDAGGNNNTAAAQFSIQYAAAPPAPAAPVPTITSAAAPGPATGLPIAFTVTFSKNVTGFEEGDIEISGIASSIDDGSFASTDNMTYTFTVSPTADGTVTVNVPANVAVDAGGNNNTAAAQFSIQYAAAPPAPAAPVPTITSAAAPGPATGLPIAFTVTFSKNVTGFEEGDIEISGIASSIDDGSFASTDNMTYTFTVSPTADGTVTVNVPANVAVDAGGNNNTAAAQFSIQYAAAPPAPAAPVPTITSAAAPGPATGLPIAFTVTFSKNVTGFEEGDIEISGIASSIDDGSFASTDNMTYTFTVSPTADGTVTVNVPANVAVDAGGNNNTAAAQFSIQYAAAPPAVPLRVESAAITGPQSITIRYDADANATGSAYHSIVVGGTPRSATLAGAGTDTHVLQFDGDPAARDATGTVTINQTAITGPGGSTLGDNATYQLALADGQVPVLASAVLDLTAGENGLLTVTFDEAAAAAPDAPLSGGDIVIRGDGGEVALSGSDVPSVASGRAGGTTFALDISGAKRVELNAADLGPATVELPAAFVSDAPGNAYAPGQQPVPLAYVPDPSPPVLVKAAFNLAPGSGNAGRLVITFDEAATAPGAQSFSGNFEIRGRSWGGDAAVSLSAADILSVESGRDGDRTFVLLVSDRVRAALDAAAFSVPESTSVLLPAGFVTNGRAAHAPERAPLDVARDPDRPSFLLAFVLNGSSVAAVYSEPVLAVPSHYTNITVGGVAVAGNSGGASEAAAFGNNVIVSWNANASTTASAGSAVGFDLSANVTDAFGNPLENPGTKSTGGPDGTGQAGKQPVQVGVFARGAADPSAEAARLGAAAFNAVSSERGYQFYVNVSEHDLPAGASGAAALRGAHAAGEGPSLYVGPASDIALAGMADYASENGITIISHSSAARSLAIGGDPIFRMEPGAAHLARALATEVARGGYGAIVPVVQAGLHGPDYGLLESLESDLGPLGIPFGDPVAFAASGGGAAAALIGANVSAAAGSGTARSVAVVYVGSDIELAAIAGSVPADGPIRERSVWFAAGGAGAGAGSGVAASPAITDDAAAIQLARDVRLSAVQFAVERNGMTDYIDRIAAPLVPDTSATPAYAAYEAVRALGGALVGAGGDPSLAGGNVAGAAALVGGPLGRTGMDGSGDLRLPVTYGAWSVSDAAAEWARAPELLLGLDACGIDLEKSALALPELSAGSTSRPARQTVTNIGTGPMPAVSVSATDWTQFLNGVPLPGPLPFSYTEMAVGLDGASPRPADSTPLAAGTEIPGGTPPGGSVDVDFRINLEDLDALEADIISQTVTFVANCV